MQQVADFTQHFITLALELFHFLRDRYGLLLCLCAQVLQVVQSVLVVNLVDFVQQSLQIERIFYL